jgi:ABC-2 type transport system permease protein
MDKLILKFMLFIVKTFLKKDVDFEKLKIITETKLILDRRRVRVSMKQKNDKEQKNQILVTQIMYAFFGLLIGFMVMSSENIVISMAIVHAYILFMMVMTLITDFSSVLLDTTDNQIILPRPVNSKTFFMARLVHILVYLLQFTLAMGLFPAIFTFIAFGALVGIANIVAIFLTVMIAVFLTYFMYGLILKFSNEEKLKEIISGFQIVITIIFVGGSQILPRMINTSSFQSKVILIQPYSYFAPPLWMAHALESIYKGNFDIPHMMMILMAFVFPILMFWVMIKFIAPSFGKKMAVLGNTGAETKSEEKNAGLHKLPLSEKLSPIFCANNIERAGFEFTWKMTGRDKSFKMQFYPSIAYILVFAFVFLFKSGSDINNVWDNLHNTKSYLGLIYLPMFTISTAVSLIAFNENFAASWVYLSRPLHKPGNLITGSIKTLIIKFLAPIFITLLALAVFIWDYKVIDDFILGIFNNIFILLMLTHINKSYLPFSMQPNMKQQTGKFILVILNFALIGALVIMHYFATKIAWFALALTPLSIVGCYFLLRTIQNYSWQKISN